MEHDNNSASLMDEDNNNMPESSESPVFNAPNPSTVLSPELQKLSKLLYTRMKPSAHNVTPSRVNLPPESPQVGTSPGRPVLRRMKSIDSSVWEELEQLYKGLQQKEQDYQMAVEIGKMLLEKNKILQDEKTQLEQQLVQLNSEMEQLTTDNGDLAADNKDLKNELKLLRVKVSVLESSGELDRKSLELEQENTTLGSRLAKYGPLLQQYKEKNHLLMEEIEKYKIELEQCQAMQRELQKKLRAKEKVVEPEETRNERDLDSLTDSYQKLAALMKELSAENKQMRERLNELENEKDNYEQQLAQLTQQNKWLKQQTEEQVLLLEEKSNRINQLQGQIEEMSLLSDFGGLRSSTRVASQAEGERMSDYFSSPSTTLPVFTPALSVSSFNLSEESQDTAELKRLRKAQTATTTVVATLANLKERLNNLPFSPNPSAFDSIIDRIASEFQHQLQTLPEQQDWARLLGDLMQENCNLRKQANQLTAREQNSASILPPSLQAEKVTIAKPEDSSGLWSFLPLFDFFTGWRSVDLPPSGEPKTSPVPNHPHQYRHPSTSLY